MKNHITEEMIKKHSKCIEYVINHEYCAIDEETKKDLYQAGLVGLCKALQKNGNNKSTQCSAMIFAYIRYEICDFLRSNTLIRMPSNYWNDFSRIKRLIDEKSDISEKELELLAAKLNIKMNNYNNAVNIMSICSLDAVCTDNSDLDGYSFVPVYDSGEKEFLDKYYIEYIVKSAFAGITSERDKKIVIMWLENIYKYDEKSRSLPAEAFGVSVGTVGSIINKFIDLCCYVRDCENAFCENPNGIIMVPENESIICPG